MAHAIPIRATRMDEAPSSALLPAGVLRTFLLVSGLFFLWGVPNNLNDILIRQFMKAFAISRFEAGLVQSAFYLGYFVMALPAGMLIRHRGYKAGFLTGLSLFALGAFLFLPAAYVGRYGLFLTALFVLASGLSFLETSANPFVAQLGPTASSERRLNIAQAFNPIGAITGALAGSLFIFSGVELTRPQAIAMQAAGTYAAYLHRETLRVVMPYLVLGCLALGWAIALAFTRFPRFIAERESAAETRGNWRALLREPHLLFALLALFLYVGAQVGTWSYFIQYAQEYAHVPERTAGYLLTGTLAAFGIGRFFSAYLMKRLLPSRLMAFYAACNVALLLAGIFAPGWIGLLGVFLTSFFMSIMFPTIFALGLKDLGPNTNIAASWLIMMIIGGGLLTPVMGWLAERGSGTASAYVVPLLGYVVVLTFSLYMTRYARSRAVRSSFEV
jgi:MFS transporter, FHS family, L-fucose permease